MNLKILLPFRIFAEKAKVLRIVAETREGAFGLLPHRLDCVAALTPGILIYETEAEGEAYVVVDEGVLVKTGPDVLVSVRRAFGGTELGQLRATLEQAPLSFVALRLPQAQCHHRHHLGADAHGGRRACPAAGCGGHAGGTDRRFR